MMDWLRKRKIATLPGGKRTAQTALAQTLEKATAGHIESVYIGIKWNDGTFQGDWSVMPASDLQLHARTAQREADHVFFTGVPSE